MVAPTPYEQAREALQRFAGGGLSVTERFSKARELLRDNQEAVKALDAAQQNAAECHAHNIIRHGHDRV